MTTGPEARQIGLGRALEDLDDRLAPWLADDQPVDFDDLGALACYTKDD